VSPAVVATRLRNASHSGVLPADLQTKTTPLIPGREEGPQALLSGATAGNHGNSNRGKRRSEVLPYSGEQSGGDDRCECDKERRNQVIDHNTNDSPGGSSTDDVFAAV
jgi:hypothetical protein